MNVNRTRELSRLIGEVYEAGLDPTGTLWPAALSRLRQMVANGGLMMLALERRRFDYTQTYAALEDPGVSANYQAYYARIDPVLEPMLTTAAPGALLRSEAVMSKRELSRTEFYTDWLRPRGISSGIGAVLLREGSASATLLGGYPSAHSPRTSTDLELLTQLLPHLTAAVRASLRVAAVGVARDALADAVDRSADAVFLVDRGCHVCTANRAGEALLAVSEGLAISPARGGGRGVLRAATPGITAALARLVHAAAAIAEPPSSTAGKNAHALAQGAGVLALPRALGQRPLSAFVSPLSARAGCATWLDSLMPGSGSPVAVVFVSDPDALNPYTAAIASERLRCVFGLTAAESAVAIDLAEGIGFAAVALRHRVTLATARTQAQNAYRKTATRGQAALASLVERLGRVG